MASEVELRRERDEVKDLIEFYKAQYQKEMALIAVLQAPPEEKPAEAGALIADLQAPPEEKLAEPGTEPPPAKSLGSSWASAEPRPGAMMCRVESEGVLSKNAIAPRLPLLGKKLFRAASEDVLSRDSKAKRGRGNKGKGEHPPDVIFYAKTVQAYSGRGKGELKFKEGVVISVVDVDSKEARYKGRLGKHEGWFPDYYVIKL